ncbi:hypothetical protein [Georgenia sp. Z1491]|uniref:hypothetical protein n=1 Tax=Georgenia sp. Z1491 TaxID=3416707 RepID=UPI003CE79198
MTLERLVTPASRVLDVGVHDEGVADALAAVGAHRYLGLVLPQDQAFLDDVPDRYAGRFHRVVAPEQAFRHDTDLLILRAPVARAVWGLRDLSHVGRIAVELTSPSARVETWGALAVSRLLRRVRLLGVRTCGESRFLVYEAQPVRRPRPRHYLSEAVGVPGLIRRLQQEGLDYVVLRWFDQLPDLAPGEDLDLMVADRHLHRLHEILAEEPGTIPVDIYSETGLEGADYRGMAYYPPRLATRMLERADTHVSGARVPSAEDHLHSLAYHAVYHKGPASGLASALVAQEPRPDHDYAATLAEVAASLGRDFPTGLEDVDAVLEEQGWRPPLDTLRRLAEDNPWVRRRFFPTADQQPAELPEPTVFFVRERTLSVLDEAEVLGVIESLEFEILAVRELSGAARQASVELVRGGNWGRGPYPLSGGDPVLVVVAVHYGPRPPNSSLLARYPRLTNGDVLQVKVDMRELVEARVGAAQSFNPVHSSDDEFETWEYLSLALPEETAELRAQVARRRDDYRTGVPVVDVLRRGRRAKVEVVEREDGRRVLRKTFAPHGARHLEREVATMRELGPVVAAVPTLLDVGPNWFETELFDNGLADLPDRPDGRLVPLRVAHDMMRVLREVHARGFDLIDAKPQNFLLEPGGELRLVDYEFSHRYDGQAPDFDQIYGFVGPPQDFTGDVPVGEMSYEAGWQPFLGLPRASLLGDPTWRQHLHRATFRARRLTRLPVRVASTGLRRGRSWLGAGRARAGASYRRWARERARGAL